MGAVALYLLNGIRQDNRDLWAQFGAHVRDWKIHNTPKKEE